MDDLDITLLIDISPIIVPFWCHCELFTSCNSIICTCILYTGISDERYYCTFRIPNMEYTTGTHSLTFQLMLNGEIRGSTTTRFVVTNGKLILLQSQFVSK